MFIQTEPTPNPRTLKFLPGRTVSLEGSRDFADRDAAQASPLAAALFDLDGVEGVFFAADHVAVTKAETAPLWDEMKPPILAALMDHFASGQPLIREGAEAATGHAEGDSEVIREIKDVLDSRIRPAVAQDGGDILFDRFDEGDGVLWLRLRGACAGCPSSAATLKAGVENMMRHYVPEVTRVEQTL